MLTFEDDTGKSMCLRPDLTVASCIKYLKDNSKKNLKIYYSGQAYRRLKSSKDKVINDQLGVEIFGSKNKSIDDLKVLKTITNSINKIKIKNTSIKVGDVSLFKKLIESLKIPERWRMRLKRHFWRPQYFEDLLNRLETNSDVDPTSVEENKKTVKIIRDFLKINCPIENLEKILNNFIYKNKLGENVFADISSLKNLSKLNSKIIFSTNFGRDIEYYSGLVFEIYNSSKKEIARGGRYDGLLKSLGSKKNISAVGAAINLNNLKI